MRRPSAGEISAAFIMILTGLGVLATAFDLDLGFSLTQKTPASPTIEAVVTATLTNIPVVATNTTTPTIKPFPSATFTPLPVTASPSASPTHLLTTVSPTIELGISPTISSSKTTVPIANTPGFCTNTARVNTGGSKLLIRDGPPNWSVVGTLSNGATITYITESALFFNNIEYVKLTGTPVRFVAQQFLTVLRTDC